MVTEEHGEHMRHSDRVGVIGQTCEWNGQENGNVMFIDHGDPHCLHDNSDNVSLLHKHFAGFSYLTSSAEGLSMKGSEDQRWSKSPPLFHLQEC